VKRLFTIAGLLAASAVGVVTLRSYNGRYAFATPTQTYPNLQDAIEGGVISKGWLPDFLPRSAYNIREKHNYEQNTVIACFSFDPVENILPMLSGANEVPLCHRSKLFPPGMVEIWDHPLELSPECFCNHGTKRKTHVFIERSEPFQQAKCCPASRRSKLVPPGE
jgi:hypothetical protein